MALSVDMRGGARPKPPGRELFETLAEANKRAFIYSGGYQLYTIAATYLILSTYGTAVVGNGTRYKYNQ